MLITSMNNISNIILVIAVFYVINCLASQCPNGWVQFGTSCYYKPELLKSWTDSITYCAELHSKLAIFYNADEYMAFTRWWNKNASANEFWIGITYNSSANKWTWLNGCTFKHYPAFWRVRWDQGGLQIGQSYYAKYSNKPNGTYAPTGVEPVLQSATDTLEVICYQPLDQTTYSDCYEFPFETRANHWSGNNLCDLAGWWCAVDHASAQNVTTAIASDSCFCLTYSSESVSTAKQSCSYYGGKLADIRSDGELNLLTKLTNYLLLNNAIQDYMCPTNFSYFNGSCFATYTSSPTPNTYPPGQYVNDQCKTRYVSARGASLHSFDEQWFLHYMYLAKFGYTFGHFIYLAAYQNDSTKNFTYHWFDGTPTDYVPPGGYYKFTAFQNVHLKITSSNNTLVLMCDNGDFGDDNSFISPFIYACIIPNANYTLYPIFVSSVNYSGVSTSQQFNLLNSDKTISSIDTTSTNPSVMSKLCRKDRIVWEQVGSSSYTKTGLTKNWNDSVNFCKARNSTLPIFYDVWAFIEFKNWWDAKGSPNDAWIGLTYDSGNWTWINNCPWKHFPGFWRRCWGSTCLAPANFYAKYSSKPHPSYAPTGAEPVSSSTLNEVVCFKPADTQSSSCFEFSSEKVKSSTGNNFLCNTGNWWCAKDHPSGQTVATAIEADSCFCLDYLNNTDRSTDQPCIAFNGTLADIRSNDEANLIVSLINELIQNGFIENKCPSGFSYHNDSCFAIIKPTWATVNPPGKYVNDYCKTNLSAQAASLHSFSEQWFLYWLYMTTLGYTYTDYLYLGAYKPDATSTFNYQWYDGSPMDYVPEWGIWGFVTAENNEYFVNGVGLLIHSDDGKIGDYFTTQQRPFACKVDSSNNTVYPILVSSVYNSQAGTAFSTQKNFLYKNKTFSALDTNTNTAALNRLCRMNRLIITSTVTTTTTTAPTTTAPTTTAPTAKAINAKNNNPMSKTEQTVAKVLSTIGCTWIIVATAVSIFLSFFIRSKNSFSFERKIRLGQEVTLCLAHVAIVTLGSKTNPNTLCNVTSLLLQYFFTSYFIFLFLDSLQTYYIYTNVISTGQCLSNLVTVLLVLGVPCLLVTLVAIFAFGNLASTFSCFVNYDNEASLANLLPGLLLCILTIVTTESSSIGEFKDLPLTSVFQKYSAMVSKHALLFKLPLSIASWMLMTIGLHYQRFYLFTFIFGLNVALGWSITLFHILENEEVKRYWLKIRKKNV